MAHRVESEQKAIEVLVLRQQGDTLSDALAKVGLDEKTFYAIMGTGQGAIEAIRDFNNQLAKAELAAISVHEMHVLSRYLDRLHLTDDIRSLQSALMFLRNLREDLSDQLGANVKEEDKAKKYLKGVIQSSQTSTEIDTQ
jgi:hypothetical protein